MVSVIVHQAKMKKENQTDPVSVIIRIITFLVGDPYKASFATVTGLGVDPSDTIFETGDPKYKPSHCHWNPKSVPP